MGNRRQILLVFALACVFSWQHAPASGDASARLRADIEYLSSPALDGRASAGRGSDVAARFIADEFRKAGLAPANGTSCFQEFHVSPVRLDTGKTSVLIARAGHEQKVGVSSVSFSDPLHAVAVSGPVVFAGFGITAPELGYDDYAQTDVRGKVVLLFDHEPGETDVHSPFNGTGLTRYAAPWYKAWNAQQHGATAVLLAVEPVNAHRPAIRDPERANAPAQALIGGEIHIPVFRVGSEGVRELLDGSGRSATALQQEIERTMKPASRALEGVSVRLEAANKEAVSLPSRNVAAVIEGSDQARRDQTIIICAHYDHLGSHNGKVYPGANDNASGVAALLEVARRFKAADLHPARSLLFIAFGSEEQVMLGSYHYVAHPLRSLAATRAVLNLDMIGRNEEHTDDTVGAYDVSNDTSNELNLVAALYAPQLAELVARENRAVGLTLSDKFDHESSTRALFRCDHLPFIYKGVPSLWLFGGFHPGYHTPNDTPERINYQKLEKVTQLTFLTARAAADE